MRDKKKFKIERKFYLQVFPVSLCIAKSAVVITTTKINTTEPCIDENNKRKCFDANDR